VFVIGVCHWCLSLVVVNGGVIGVVSGDIGVVSGDICVVICVASLVICVAVVVSGDIDLIGVVIGVVLV
jgi:hypothetical protein